MKLRTGSFCSGILAPEVAWRPLGWEARYFSEIDPFACAVEAERFPGVPNLGDMRRAWFLLKYGGRRIARGRATPGLIRERDRLLKRLRAIDVLVAGTPCQAFSVAGKRESLADDRGDLTLCFVGLVHAIDPRIVVWENVPGVLSTKDNAFGCFLAGLVGEAQPLVCGAGSWPDAGMAIGPKRSAAWRVLDAQYLHLAQRRERVFVVSFRTRDGANPGAVLFEPESLRRHHPPSREAGQGTAGCLTSRAGNGSRQAGANGNLVPEVSPALKARDYKGPSSDGDGDGAPLIPTLTHSLRADGFDGSEDGTGRGTPLVPVSVAQNQRGELRTSDIAPQLTCGGGKPGEGFPAAMVPVSTFQNTGQGWWNQSDVAGTIRTPEGSGSKEANLVAFSCKDSGQDAGATAPTLRAMEHDGSHANAGRQVAVAYRTSGNCGVMQQGDRTAALNCGTDPNQNIVAYAFTERGRENGRSLEAQENIAYSLMAPNGGGRRQEMNVSAGMAVRRLTPTECERLQGFPDGWTAIPYRGKPAADGPRYRALGNSMAVPCLRWIGERIVKVLGALEAKR